MKLLIGGKTRNIYKRKDGSAYYKSGGQQVDITHMFKKKGGGLKKKYIKGGTIEQEFNDLKQKCIELHKRLTELHDELKDHRFSNDKDINFKIKSLEFTKKILTDYYEGDEKLKKLASEINKLYKSYKSGGDYPLPNYKSLMEKLEPVSGEIESLATSGDSSIKKELESIVQFFDQEKSKRDFVKFNKNIKEILKRLIFFEEAIKEINKIGGVVLEEDLPSDTDEEEEEKQINKDGIKSITFEPIKINSKETDNKKALKQICCLALYGLAAGMTDMLNVNLETSENKDKIKVLNKIKDTQQFIKHLKQSYNTLSIDKNPTVEDINTEIKPFGFLNYNEGDGVFVTRAYILNKILQCFEGKDYIASNKKSIVKSKIGKLLLLNGKNTLINPETGIMNSTKDEDLSQLFNNIHTIVKLTNVGSDDKIDISFSNLYYVLFSEEDIGSSQTETEAKQTETATKFDALAEKPRAERKEEIRKTLANPEIPSTAEANQRDEHLDRLKQMDEVMNNQKRRDEAILNQKIEVRKKRKEEIRKTLANQIDERPSTSEEELTELTERNNA